MKKMILFACVILMPCFFMSGCKNDNNTTSEKVDFTKAYEEAAAALTTAQKNYNLAVASKDPAKIAAATKELQAAQAKYEGSRKTYVANGGTVNQEYENTLKASQESVQKSAAVVSSVAGVKDSVSAKVENVKTQTQKSLKNVGTKATEVKEGIKAGKAKLKETTESTKKKVESDVNETKNQLKSLIH